MKHGCVSGRSLARVGVHFTVPERVGASGVNWYGRGPHENYSDRNRSALLRHHRMDNVADMHVPYVFPGMHISNKSFISGASSTDVQATSPCLVGLKAV